MISSIFWNIRGVKSKKAIHRFKKIIQINKVDSTVIMEPFVNMDKINKYMNSWDINTASPIQMAKFGSFAMEITRKQLLLTPTSKLSLKDFTVPVTVTCMLQLFMQNAPPVNNKRFWTDLNNVHNMIRGSWCIGGDFNVILYPEQKMGGKPHRMRNSLDFSSCMDA